MIKTGIDLVAIKKIANMVQKSDRFAKELLTDLEYNYYLSKTPSVKRKGVALKQYQTLAGIFACKEAVLKALGIGILNGVNFKELQIDHKNSGEPYLTAFGNLKQKLEELKVKSTSISITHDGDYAVAICVLEI